MPPDTLLPDVPVAEFEAGRRPAAVSARSAPALPSPADLRQATLKHEIARLLRERERLLALHRPAEAATAPAMPADVARLAAKDRLIRALYASRSWRFGAPLRALSRLLGQPQAPTAEQAIAETDAAGGELATAAGAIAAWTSVRRRPADRRRGEVLVVGPHLPLFDRQAGGLRLKTLIEMISGMGWSVTFASLLPAERGPGLLGTAEGQEVYEQALRAAGVGRFAYGTEAIRALLIEYGGAMRYAFLSFPEVAQQLTPLIRAHCPWARVLFDTVDLHFLRLQREARLHGDAALAAEVEAVRQVELACLRSADVTLAVSDEERAILLDLAPDAVVMTLPCVFEMPARSPPGPGDRCGLLFLGGFWHKPNIDAVLWFVDEVWPLIRARRPDLVFRIAGADPTPEIRALGRQPCVEVLGHVADLVSQFDAARVFVAPLRYGAGMKGKVGQSLIHGLPVVATAVGAEGMGLVDDEHLLVAESPEAFAAAVLRMCADDGLWSRLQADGQAHIAATLSTAVVSRRLETLLRV